MAQRVVSEIIAGNAVGVFRKWRTSGSACIGAGDSRRASPAIALIENIQREDLNPASEAQGICRLIEEFGLTHQQAADAVGRSRPATNQFVAFASIGPRPYRRYSWKGS